MSIRIRRPPSSNNSWADLQIKLFIDDLERNFNKFVEETADGAINLFATNGSFSGTLDAPSGTFGTVTAGLLQGTNLLIDLDATGTDPVIQHDAFVLFGDGSAIFGGELMAASIATNSGLTGDLSLTIGTQQGASILFGFAPGPGTTRIDVGADVVALTGTSDVVIDAPSMILSAATSLSVAGVEMNDVSFGANDSGGAGYRLMLYPNA